MPRIKKEERWAEVHADAKAIFEGIMSTLKVERQMCLDDRRFCSIAGAQWEGDLKKQFENKPKFEVNKIHLAVLRIINEYRNNRITARFVPKDGAESDDLADTCAGLFRADEHDSCAEEAYDNSFEEAVEGGFGALRLRAVYEDEEDPDNDHQRIRIEPIYDADSSVFFDLDAKRQDKADAKHGFVMSSMTRDLYESTYDDDPSTWGKDVSSAQFDWATPDSVFVLEYYRVEDKGDTRVTFRGAAGDEAVKLKSELDKDPAIEEELAATGYEEVSRRRFTKKVVHKYVMSGSKILEDEGIIAGKCIPVIPVFGKRWFIDNIERCMGHVRLVKDAQRLKNMQLSKLGELSAISGVSKPIFTPEQVKGLEQWWAEDNIKNYPYALVNPITGADGNPMPAAALGYTKAPEVPQALAALLTLTEQDMQSMLGNQQEADKMVSNIATKTVEMIQSRMDMQTYIYVSNFAKAVRRVGEVWLSMAKELYVEDKRTMKTMTDSNEVGTVTLNAPAKDPESGAVVDANDLTAASFDVAVDVGPSSTSKREATVRSLTGMLQATQDPETAMVLQSMAIMNMEGEGIGDIKEFFRKKLVKMGALKPSEEDRKEMAAVAATAKPGAQEKALEAMANEADANATKQRASVLKTMAEVEKIHAETVQILADTDMSTAEKASLLMEKYGMGAQAVPEAPAQSAPGPEALPEIVQG
jgi:hypothetical protein